MVEANIWDDTLNDLSISDLARVSSYTEISQKLRTYADNKLKGVYACARCRAALYSSEEKFTPLDSGADEWPTFRAPISQSSIQFQHTFSFGIHTTQIHCAVCGLFLGNLYQDGKECGDNHENAKERHSLNSFTLAFIKDQAENGEERIQQNPRDLVALLQKEKILVPVEAQVEIKPVVKNNAPVDNSPKEINVDNNNNNNQKKITKDEQVRQLLNDLSDDKKPSTATTTPTPKAAKKDNNNNNNNNTVRNVVIGGVVVAAVAGAIYYFTSKDNNSRR